jgi:hypothetical protein
MMSTVFGWTELRGIKILSVTNFPPHLSFFFLVFPLPLLLLL